MRGERIIARSTGTLVSDRARLPDWGKGLMAIACWGWITILVTSTAAIAPARAQAEDEAQDVTIEEIIVTARKREERLQETPISITAFSAADLQRRTIESLSDIGRSTPNMDFSFSTNGSGSGTNAQIYIRGVGQQDFLLTTDPGVGIYVDGVYFARSMGGVLDVLDFERVEVLRGPQGTLFGKNTIGGAINIVTAKPGNDFAGRATVTGGNYSRIDANLSIDIPLVEDKLLAKFAASSRNRDGYGRRLIDNKKLGDINRDSSRLVLRWLASDNVDVTLSADYSRVREESVQQALVFVDPTNAPILQLWNALVGFPSGQPITSDLIQADPFDTLQTGRSINNLDQWGLALTIDWDLGTVNIKSITAYRDQEADFARDGDGSPATYVHTFNQTAQNQFSQELQFSGSSFGERLHWLAGGYLFDEDAVDNTDVDLAGGLFNALEMLPGPLICLGPGGTPPCAGGAGNPFNQFLDLQFFIFNDISIKSYAGFGQGTFNLTDRLSLTAGLRYTYEKKTYSLTHIRKNAGTFVVPPTVISDNWNSVSPRFGIEYQASPDLLFYSSAARGFKSGGFNGRPTTQGEVESYDPEFLWSYEVGLKSEWFGRRLRFNTALFYNDYTDIQLSSVRATPEGNLLLVVENAGKAKVKGFEIELLTRPIANLELSGGIGFIDAKFTKLAPGATITTDSKFPKTPKWNVNLSLEYRIFVGASGDLSMRWDYAYKARIENDVNNTPAISQKGYSLVNARLTYEHSSEAWQAFFFITNLTDTRYIENGIAALDSFGTAEAYFGRPREWGLGVTYRF